MTVLLADFRGRVSVLRRRLKGELDDPDEAYRIVPKKVRRVKPEQPDGQG